MRTACPTSFEIEPLADGTGFRLAGELDLGTAPELGAVLSGAQLADGVVLDVRELTFIDSSGWGVLCAYAASREQAHVTLVNAGPPVARALALMGLDQHPRIEIR